jgi:hypothetical protein
MLHTLHFSLQKAFNFIMLPFFVSCIIHILHTGVLKFKCKTPVPKRLRSILILSFSLGRRLQSGISFQAIPPKQFLGTFAELRISHVFPPVCME